MGCKQIKRAVCVWGGGGGVVSKGYSGKTYLLRILPSSLKDKTIKIYSPVSLPSNASPGV